MPMFDKLRDSRGRFVGHSVSNDLENSLKEAISNVNPSAWKRFWTLTEQRLGMNPWEFIRQHGANIPLGQITGLTQQNRPLIAAGASPGLFRPIEETKPSDPTFKVLQDIDRQEHAIKDILARQVAAGGGPVTPRVPSQAGLRIPPIPSQTGVPSWWQWHGPVMGGGPAAPGGIPTGWAWPGPGGVAPAAPGGAGGGRVGGGGRGGGGAGRGVPGATPGGFGFGAAVGSFLPPAYRRMLGVGTGGYLGYEVLRDLINPIGAFNRDLINPAASAAQRSWQFRLQAYGLAGSGGPGTFGAESFINRTYNRAGVGTVIPEPWMGALGLGPEEAQQNLQDFGIKPRTEGEAIRNEIALGIAQRALPGFRGMDPKAAIGFARTAMGVGVGGGQELGHMPLMQLMSDTLSDAVTKGADRSRLLENINASMEQAAKTGPTVMLPQMLDLFDRFLKTSLPGGMTGESAQRVMSGQAAALETVGKDPTRTFTMMLEMRKHQMNLREVLGPDIQRQMTPEMEQMLSEAQDLANRGLYQPAADILAKIIPAGSQRWLQIQQEIMPQMLPFRGLQKLGIERGAGVPYREQTGLELAPLGTEGITRGGVAEDMWKWAKAHGYTDEAAATLIGEAQTNPTLAAQRSRFKKELEENPELKKRLATVIDLENPAAGTAVAESLMNRMAMTGDSIKSGISGGPNSFYGPLRRGEDITRLRELERDPERMQARMRQIDQALAGSNLTRGHTDQGSRGDPNYEAGGVGVNIAGERFNDWGGYLGVDASRAWRIHQQEQVVAGADSDYLEWAKKNNKDPSVWQSRLEYQDSVIQERDPWFKYQTDLPTANQEYDKYIRRLRISDDSTNMRNAYSRQAINTFSGTTDSTFPTFPDGGAVSPDRRVEDRAAAMADMPAYGTTQRFGELTAGLQLPPQYPSIAVASQAGLAASEQSAKLFGDNIATASQTVVTGFHNVGEAANNLATKLMEVISKIKTDAYGPTPSAQPHTEPRPTVQ